MLGLLTRDGDFVGRNSDGLIQLQQIGEERKMQRATGRAAGAREIRWISLAVVISFLSAGLLLRLLIYDDAPALSFTSWRSSAPVLLQTAMPPRRAAESNTFFSSSSPSPSPIPPPSLGPTPSPSDAEQQLARMLRLVSPSISELVQVWELLAPVFSRQDLFPEARNKMSDASAAWGKLAQELQEREKKFNSSDGSTVQCPFSVRRLTSGGFNFNQVELEIPCGMVLDSSVTLVGVPDALLGDEFRIELVGQTVPGETKPPIIFHHNVRLGGDKLSAQQPVIVENTWTSATDWEEELRCPSSASAAKSLGNKTVDGLVVCAPQVGKGVEASLNTKWAGNTKAKNSTTRQSFPYADGHPFVATLWVGWDGFHVTVDGKHITSFEYRQNLEPWMVSGVSIEGGLQLSSVIANGLPTSESQETLIDLETLKAPPLPDGPLDLFIGVFSTGNNFERRMAVRRSWMQYEGVRSGNIAVRFFVGLHQNQQVNMELWKEGITYGDIQLLPIVDYYNLITLKTLAICIFATKVVKSHYVMKTDDDTFVRVDQVLHALRASNRSHSLLYGLIEHESKPSRDLYSKWYINPEEWPSESYPPWAHGPGYIFSKDVAEFVVQRHEEKELKLFKLEDVAMGAWIEEYGKAIGRNISYVNDASFQSEGCKMGYTIAHYQNPRQMVCMWHQIHLGLGPVCC